MVRNEMMCFEVKVCKSGEKCVFNLQDIRAQGIIERERKKINSLRRTVRKEKRTKFKLC